MFGSVYTDLLINENIIPIFEVYDDKKTGLCMVVCNNNERSHFTDLGVSTEISEKFVNKIWDKIKDCSLIFTELFIIKHQYKILKRLALLGSDKDKIFGFNLPSFYFLENFLPEILDIYNNADIVFCNLSEARFFASQLLFREFDVRELLLFLASLPKNTKNKNRIIVATNGPEPAYALEYSFQMNDVVEFKEVSCRPIDSNKVIDTNGAGDSFAGGFLSQWVQGKSLEDSMICGHWAASLIVQNRGCQIPYGLEFNIEHARKDIYG